MDASAPFYGLEEFIQGETLESRLWQSCIATLIWVGDFSAASFDLTGE